MIDKQGVYVIIEETGVSVYHYKETMNG